MLVKETKTGECFCRSKRLCGCTKLEVPTWGREDPRTAAVAIREGFAEALVAEHNGIVNDTCGPSCDICEMVNNGFVTVAWHVLTGATEVPCLDAMYDALVWNYGHAAVTAALGAHMLDAPDMEGWREHHGEYGRNCEHCNSYSFAGIGYEPENCGSCGKALPVRDDAFV